MHKLYIYCLLIYVSYANSEASESTGIDYNTNKFMFRRY